MSISKVINVWNLGRMNYLPALNVQNALVRKILANPMEQNNTLLLVEHAPVYTIGIRTSGYPVEEENRLKKLGAEFHRTNRGGLITFHGPGQLVAYPILNLAHFQKSMKWYVRQLEETVVRLCRMKYDLPATTSCDTGVWIGDSKICALGVHGARFVTSHGLALNCNIDLKWFSHVVPCGLQGKGVTSISEQIGGDVSIQEVTPHLIRSFQEQFDVEVRDVPSEFSNEILQSAVEVS